MWDVNDLFEYWQESPPTHVLVAAYLLSGSKKQRGLGKPGRSPSLPGFSELTAAVNLAGGAVKGKLPELYRRSERVTVP
ncbi:MAG TPA: hypothetical protein VFK06_10930 [Candidatus Angelobacter sp.]|nr:hypothetical protein [Candidatus Angelobacter sp.]